MLTITRKSDSRVVKCLLHRVADIPGGVTIKVANLGGSALVEGTPIGVGSNGLYEVVKTAVIVTAASATGTSIEVAKGHHFKVGDYIAFSSTNKGNVIAAIDKSNSAKDVITLTTGLAGDLAVGAVGVQTTSGTTYAPKYTAVGVVGSSYDVESSTNLFVDAWVIGVIKESNAPVVNATIKGNMTGIVYV